jgi:endonuclease/exonuclease/phosphatase family metal-dependent hydrolase
MFHVALLLLLPFFSMAQDLKVLSWNTYLLPPVNPLGIVKLFNDTHQEERAQQMATKLAAADYEVLFLQETFHKASRNKLEKGLKEKFPHHAYPEKKKFMTFTSSGLAVYSKHPMKVLDEIVFRHAKGSDKLARKGAMLVEVELPGGKKAQFVNTHLQAWNNPEAAEIRLQQLQEIKEVMKRHQKDGVPQFIVGDLNIDGNKPIEFQEAIKLLEMEPSKLQGEIQVTNGFDTPCFKNPGGEEGGEWLDHLFQTGKYEIQSKVVPIKGQLKYKDPKSKKLLCDDCLLSDHHAVEHVIKLTPNP